MKTLGRQAVRSSIANTNTIGLIATPLDIDATVGGDTAIFSSSVSDFLVTSMYAELKTITGGVGVNKFPKISLGVLSPYENVYLPTRLVNIDTVGEIWHFNVTGGTVKINQNDILRANVETVSNADDYLLTLYLFGYEL